MRTINFTCPSSPHAQPSQTARLVRHLAARLNDFAPGGPEVLQADQTQGIVRVRFPGRSAQSVLNQLSARYGIIAAEADDCAVFYLSAPIRFEDLDYTWGALFDIL